MQTLGTVDFFKSFGHGVFNNDSGKLENWFMIEMGFNLRIPGWEDVQSMLGNGYSHLRNILGRVDNVEFHKMSMVVDYTNNNQTGRQGITLGPYINTMNFYRDNWTNGRDHEYGHTLQSRVMGPFYTLKSGLPSIITSSFVEYHEKTWYEVWASKWGDAANFNQKYRYSPWWYWLLNIYTPFFPN